MKKIRLKELFNIPNCLCYLRIILIPIFLHRYFLAGSKEDYYICATILIISGLSDFLDGYIARHYQMITDFGKVIDPIADKLTQFTIAVTLLFNYPLIGRHIPNSIFATISIFVCIMLMLLSLVLYAKQLLSIYKELKNE